MKGDPLGRVREAARRGDRTSRAAVAAETIRETGGFRWVGIYDLQEEEIAAIAWTGDKAPAHPRFPREQGLCGAAAASGETVVVGDVTQDPRYLTTFGSTRSEIVVPVRNAKGDMLGLLDVESERVDAFGDDERRFLEGCAAALAGLWS